MSSPKDARRHPGPEPDRLLDHNYDGIQEYDNPMPKWWVYIFYATILFAVLYALNLPGIGTGKGRIANYEREMAEARARQEALAAQAPKLEVTDQSLLALAANPQRLAAGKAVFTNTCSPCHRPDGGGSIGPNLTDDYWIHGGRPSEMFRTVHDGVLEKGMPAWGQTLKPDDVLSVVAYVTTLRGTHPPDPKEPQGVKVEEREPAAPAAASEKPE